VPAPSLPASLPQGARGANLVPLNEIEIQITENLLTKMQPKKLKAPFNAPPLKAPRPLRERGWGEGCVSIAPISTFRHSRVDGNPVSSVKAAGFPPSRERRYAVHNASITTRNVSANRHPSEGWDPVPRSIFLRLRTKLVIGWTGFQPPLERRYLTIATKN
jgi:hypothetical protein